MYTVPGGSGRLHRDLALRQESDDCGHRSVYACVDRALGHDAVGRTAFHRGDADEDIRTRHTHHRILRRAGVRAGRAASCSLAGSCGRVHGLRCRLRRDGLWREPRLARRTRRIRSHQSSRSREDHPSVEGVGARRLRRRACDLDFAVRIDNVHVLRARPHRRRDEREGSCC